MARQSGQLATPDANVSLRDTDYDYTANRLDPLIQS